MALSSSRRQDIQVQGPSSGALLLLIPEEKLSGMFKVGTVMTLAQSQSCSILSF